MAKKNDLSSADFLKDIETYIGTSTGSTLLEKRATRARRKAMKPLVDAIGWSSIFDDAFALRNERKAIHDTELSAYLAANPEIDASDLFPGITDQASEIMKSGNMTYRQVVKELAGMNPMHEDYEGLTKQLNDINANAAQLKEDNDKLLSLKNEIAGMSEKDWGNLKPSSHQMYKEIGMGNGENFKVVDGRLYWVDPDHPATKISVPDSPEAGSEQAEFDKLDEWDKLFTNIASDLAGETELMDAISNLNKVPEENRKSFEEIASIGEIDIKIEQGIDYSSTKNSNIEKLQGLLIKLGYKLPKKGIDGKMEKGGETEAALNQYKKDRQGRVDKIIEDYRAEKFGEEVGMDVEDYGIKVSSINAEAPKKSFTASEKSTALHSKISKLNLDLSKPTSPNSIQFNHLMTSFFRGLEDKELHSLIWDNDVADDLGWNGTMLSTRSFIDEFIQKTTNATTPEELNRERDELMENVDRNGFRKEFEKWYTEEFIKPAMGTDVTETKKKSSDVTTTGGDTKGTRKTTKETEKEITSGIIDHSTGENITEKQLLEYYDIDISKEGFEIEKGDTFIPGDKVKELLKGYSDLNPSGRPYKIDANGDVWITKKDGSGWGKIAKQEYVDAIKMETTKLENVIGKGSRLENIKTVNVGTGDVIKDEDSDGDFYEGDVFFPAQGGNLITMTRFTDTGKESKTNDYKITGMTQPDAKKRVVYYYKEGFDENSKDWDTKGGAGKGWYRSDFNFYKPDGTVASEVQKMRWYQIHDTAQQYITGETTYHARYSEDKDITPIKTTEGVVTQGDNLEVDFNNYDVTQAGPGHHIFSRVGSGVLETDISISGLDKIKDLDVSQFNDTDYFFRGLDKDGKQIDGKIYHIDSEHKMAISDMNEPQYAKVYNRVVTGINQRLGTSYELKGTSLKYNKDGNLENYDGETKYGKLKDHQILFEGSSLKDMFGPGSKYNKTAFGSISDNQYMFNTKTGILYYKDYDKSTKEYSWKKSNVSANSKPNIGWSGYHARERTKETDGYQNREAYDNLATTINNLHIPGAAKLSTANYITIGKNKTKYDFSDFANSHRFAMYEKGSFKTFTDKQVKEDLGDYELYKSNSSNFNTGADYPLYYEEDQAAALLNAYFTDIQGYGPTDAVFHEYALGFEKQAPSQKSKILSEKGGFMAFVYKQSDLGQDSIGIAYYPGDGKDAVKFYPSKEIADSWYGSPAIDVEWGSEAGSKMVKLRDELKKWAEKLEADYGEGNFLN